MAFPLQAEEQVRRDRHRRPQRSSRRSPRPGLVAGAAGGAGPTSPAPILLVFVITGVFAGLLAPYDPEAPDLANSLQPPWFAGGSSDHILGTDDLGRDVLSRLIYGARVSLLVSHRGRAHRRLRRRHRRRASPATRAAGSTPSSCAPPTPAWPSP